MTGTGPLPRPRQRVADIGPRSTRTAAAVAAAAVLALLLAACGGSSSPSGSRGSHRGGSSSSTSAIAYSACMRSHGVPNFPDPDRSGQHPKGDPQQCGVRTAAYQAAQLACRHLLPTGGSLQQQEQHCWENHDCPQALVQQMLTADRKFAQCMRSHGVPNFPDPTLESDGPVFYITRAGISDAESHTHQFEARLDECERRVGGNAPYQFG
jgi:hypothetical protein